MSLFLTVLTVMIFKQSAIIMSAVPGVAGFLMWICHIKGIFWMQLPIPMDLFLWIVRLSLQVCALAVNNLF